DGVLAGRLPEFPVGRRERRARTGGLLLKGGLLRLRQERVRLAELELGQVPERTEILRPQLRVLGPGGDRLVDPTLVLERSGEILASSGVERVLHHLGLSLRDGGRRAAAPSERITDQRAEI